jgi:GWxTD domain-containing protein
MMQKYHILIYAAVFWVLGCKVQHKTPVGNDAVAAKTAEKRNENLFVSAVKSQYIIKDSTRLEVFVEAAISNLSANEVNSISEFAKKLKTNWLLQPSTGIKERLESGKIELNEQNAVLTEDKVRFRFEIPRLKGQGEVNLVLEFVDMSASRKFTNDLFIDYNSKRPNALFGVYTEGADYPSFESFFQQGQKIIFKSGNGNRYPLTLKRYESTVPAALSPMSTSKRNELEYYLEKESKEIQTDVPVLLEKEGTYVVFLNGTEEDNGYGFLVVDDRFPRLTMPDKLTEPLIYMSTNSEISSLKEAQEFKKALDLYFLGMTSGNQPLAKSIIRSYFRRVEKTNQLFTTYKEGWKTDKGMIYLILGPPSRVQRNGNREVWLYAQSANFSEIIFTFYKKPNQFSEDHYELVRYPEYGAYWFPFVEAWRTGSVLE